MNEYIIHINGREKTETLQKIEESILALRDCTEEERKDKILAVLNAIGTAIRNGDRFVIPVELPPEAEESIKASGLEPGDPIHITDDWHLKYRTLQLKDGSQAYAAFTSREEVDAGEATSTITEEIDIFLEKVLKNPNVDGVMVNPWNLSFYLPKSFIHMIFEGNLLAERENILHFAAMDITQAEVACIVHIDGTGEPGEVELSEICNLPAMYIIRTAGPVYSGTEQDGKLLRNCYWNALELARFHNIHSIAFPTISGYPLTEATEIALKTVSDWLKINPSHGMDILFACNDDETRKVYDSVWTEHEDTWNQRPIIRENNGILEQAMTLAMEAHRGGVRKGTSKPYILHPVETLQILSAMDADINLMIAGLLHDTVEDTPVTILDIYDQFGTDVAALVNSHTEDKRNIWYMRKLHTVTELPKENIRQKMLTIADKVANLRSMYADYKQLGDELWARFNAPKHLQAWYYSKLIEGLAELQNFPQTEDVYWEMNRLYKELFVSFLVDDSKGILYQVGADGTKYVLKKGKPQWNLFEKNVPRKARMISRKEAERIEDNWAEPFWEVHELDLSDAIYELYKTEERYLFATIQKGEFFFTGEFTEDGLTRQLVYQADSNNTHRLLVQLRLKHGTRNKLSTILKKAFGREEGLEDFFLLCKEHGIEYQP